MMIEVACICGNNLRDVGRNGQLRDRDVNKLLETAVRPRVTRYREAFVKVQSHAS